MTETIAVVEKSARSDVRISLGAWRGQPNFQIREFEFWAGIAAGRKGTQNKITLPVSRLPEMRRAICKAEAQAIERGLLPGAKAHHDDGGPVECGAAI